MESIVPLHPSPYPPKGPYEFLMQGCHTPPPPPPHGIPPLSCFPLWSCLASSPLPTPPPVEWGLWSFWLAPPRLWGGSVFYRRMVCLLPLVSSNVIVTCLVPSPPCGVGPVVVLVGPAPPVWGSVFYKDMYGMVAAAC